MQATTATFLAGGSGRSPLSKEAAYCSLLASSSSVLLTAGLPFGVIDSGAAVGWKSYQSS